MGTLRVARLAEAKGTQIHWAARENHWVKEFWSSWTPVVYSLRNEEDKGATPAGPGPEASGQELELNLSNYSAAAGPFEALLACIGQAPELVVTLWSLPSKFGNAEGPVQLLSTGQCPANHTQIRQGAQKVIGRPSSGQSPAKQAAAPGKESSVSSLKAGMGRIRQPCHPNFVHRLSKARQGVQHSLGVNIRRGQYRGKQAQDRTDGSLTCHTEPAGQPVVTPAPAAQSKPGRFGKLRAKLTKPSEHAEPELEPESRLSSKLIGFKNCLLKPSAKHQSGLDASHNGASEATPSFAPGSEFSPLDSAYRFWALAAAGRDAAAAASTASWLALVLLVAAAYKQAAWYMLRSLCNIPSAQECQEKPPLLGRSLSEVLLVTLLLSPP
ncbi:hypothetical protein WJX77_008548 [Trebouxia sp. C0004]